MLNLSVRLSAAALKIGVLAAGVLCFTGSALGRGHSGTVYTMTNGVSNAILVFDRAPDGTLSPAGMFATNGKGTGAGLGSQGAIALSDDGRWLLAVNAGSNEVTVSSVTGNGLMFRGKTDSGERCR